MAEGIPPGYDYEHDPLPPRFHFRLTWAKAIHRAEQKGRPAVAGELREWAYDYSLGQVPPSLRPINVKKPEQGRPK